MPIVLLCLRPVLSPRNIQYVMASEMITASGWCVWILIQPEDNVSEQALKNLQAKAEEEVKNWCGNLGN